MMVKQTEFRFSGSNYKSEYDNIRLTGQIKRVFKCMKDNGYLTLDEISKITKDPHASISAQLRHLRKERFGAHQVLKRPRGDRSSGLWEYRLIINKDSNVAY